jgi:protein subunit release factor B
VTADDCNWIYQRGSGKGGQAVNKTNNAVRCIHKASGAQGYSHDTRSQRDNRSIAFKRMAETKEFKKWHKLEVARRMGIEVQINEEVDRQMRNIKIECKEDGKWAEYKGE